MHVLGKKGPLQRGGGWRRLKGLNFKCLGGRS